ncbi:hypothetical protein Pla110_20060 [Polystyrenella longa]|uniref:Cytochrome c domain-containing protein n=1 Tax=Polystyrenella longa TaxID=2528007 RepID=A0A518CM16_9PLAN|nr:PVC-type heme-binding CxxCH protein [Polystyrenella longa]QDU80280.1 hypothetical protein Pla110_20060 [Polystyrenella longa]
MNPIYAFIKWTCLPTLLLASLCVPSSPLFAQRDLTDIPDTDPELERRELQVHEDFEISLYASDPRLAKPIQMNFDTQGRLWIASSETYPHIEPGATANDKIWILEDTDEDGVADKTTIFADGLLIPTGVEPTADGKGAYVANSTDLLYFEDTDGDGQADKREIVLTGFGTEDTHHILHTFRWGPDGCLYMNQSIYIHSHLETPYGVKRLNGSGIWRFRPETMELDVVAKGMVNPWGHDFDRWGQAFATDGAGSEGIQYIFDGAAYLTAVGVPRLLNGMNPGSPKFCGLEILGGSQLPEDWQGNMITNDFRGHRVCRFVLDEFKSGFSSQEKAELIKTEHVAFRPIDVKMGPDGAIYIADWYNPIIQHGEVDFRDDRRDHTHGRIWRITYKNKPVLKKPNLVDMSDEELISQLASIEPWVRVQSKRLIQHRGSNKLKPVLEDWLAKQDPKDEQYEHHLLEALWAYQSWLEPNAELLTILLAANDHKARAAGVSILSDWIDEIPNSAELLASAAQDESPRVRLEAIRGLARIPEPESMLAALKVLDQPMDTFLDYALWVTARDLQPVWLPAVQAGDVRFLEETDKLLFLFNAMGGDGGVNLLIDLVQQNKIPAEQLPAVYRLFLQQPNPTSLGLVYTAVLNEENSQAARAGWLTELANVAATRNVVPAGDLNQITSLVDSSQSEIRLAAISAIGAWKLQAEEEVLFKKLGQEELSVEEQRVLLQAIARIGSGPGLERLRNFAQNSENRTLQTAAAIALLKQNDPAAATVTADLLSKSDSTEAVNQIMQPIIANEELAKSFVEQLGSRQLSRDVAVLSLRQIQQSGRQLPELTAAITKSAQIQTGPRKLSPEEMTHILELVKSEGDAARGETIYRREILVCQQCHAIAGAGGRVGPDLLSLGASAQPDYLVNSLLDPNDKVKENYHTTVIITEDGKTFSGIKVRETDSDVILRNADDNEFSVPLDSVDEEFQGKSMMPTGLTDSLTEAEFVDLVKFLSDLGRTDEFSVSKKLQARSWQYLIPTEPARHLMIRTRVSAVASENEVFNWKAAYTTVGGKLPVDMIPGFNIRHPKEARGFGFVRAELLAEQATRAELLLGSTEGLEVWLDEEPLTISDAIPLELTEGTHHITIKIDLDTRKEAIQAELVLPEDKASAAKWYLGK